MSETVQFEWASPWGWVLSESGWGMLVVLVVFVLFLGLSIDGARLVFRGTRDYIHVTMGKRPTAARFAAFIAAVLLFFSGWAPVVTVVSWFAGVAPFGRWPNPNDPTRKASQDTPQ